MKIVLFASLIFIQGHLNPKDCRIAAWERSVLNLLPIVVS